MNAARKMQGQQRNQLLKMAATWERLAADSSVWLQRHPELALEGHDEEEATWINGSRQFCRD